MITTDDLCVALQRWLTRAEDLSPWPPPDLAAHVAGCPRCRGALAGFLAHLLIPLPPGEVSCDDCAEDLPAYIELERAQGAAAAARSYPQLWWHLWTCPDCAAATENLTLLLDAEAAGRIPPPPSLAPARYLPPIRLSRGFLHTLFGPQLVLGARWHEGADPLLLTEHNLPDCRVSIHVHQTTAEQWELEITVEPPIRGHIVVAFGETRYRAALIHGRVARVREVPAALLAGQAGPDMQLVIERE